MIKIYHWFLVLQKQTRQFSMVQKKPLFLPFPPVMLTVEGRCACFSRRLFIDGFRCLCSNNHEKIILYFSVSHIWNVMHKETFIFFCRYWAFCGKQNKTNKTKKQPKLHVAYIKSFPLIYLNDLFSLMLPNASYQKMLLVEKSQEKRIQL